MATADTPWSDAFEAIYHTVASEYALPQGKNRLHKFKEKMIELWSAMQGEVSLIWDLVVVWVAFVSLCHATSLFSTSRALEPRAYRDTYHVFFRCIDIIIK